MKIAFYGSSLLSSYWNGAATYYRGLLKALADLGHNITFYEPDAFDRQKRRDIDPPPWCSVVVYEATVPALMAAAAQAVAVDVVVKTSGVGYEDDLLLGAVLQAAHPAALRIFWDVDAPATLAQVKQSADHPLRRALDDLDMVFTYGGGAPVVNAYRQLGARNCKPIYNGLDPSTHHPAPRDERFAADLAFLGNRLPDREARVDEFYFRPAAIVPGKQFLLGGAGWDDRTRTANVRWLDHVPTRDHNAFNCTPRAVLNITRDSMAANGHSPPTRVFEAAGAGACLITDAWEGVDTFLKPEEEVLVARDGDDVAEILSRLSKERARAIGQSALARVRRDHTYQQRAAIVDDTLRRLVALRQGAPA